MRFLPAIREFSRQVSLRTPPSPDASLLVLTMTDELALGARSALAAANRAATLTGWDGSEEALAAGVITVSDPLREQGRICARAVLDPTTVPQQVSWEILDPGELRAPEQGVSPSAGFGSSALGAG